MNNDHFHGSSMNKTILGLLILCLLLFPYDTIMEDNKCEQDTKYVYPVGKFYTHVNVKI